MMANRRSRRAVEHAADGQRPISLWRFDDAPEELRIPYNGGDEDFLILVPPGLEIPMALENLGCSSNDFYRVNGDGSVDCRVGGRTWDDKTCEETTTWERTEWRCPSYPGFTVIVANHG